MLPHAACGHGMIWHRMFSIQIQPSFGISGLQYFSAFSQSLNLRWNLQLELLQWLQYSGALQLQRHSARA